jgi:hypothetical protein
MLKKSKENFHFKYINIFNIDDLQNIVKNITFDKNQSEYDRRDSTFSGALGGSRNVYDSVTPITINETNLSWTYGEDIHSDQKCDIALAKEIDPIIKHLEKHVNGKVAEVSLNNLKAGNNIIGHYDTGDYYEYMRRFHIPLETNPDVVFHIEKSSVMMSIGQCWEVNNAKYHYVQNDGEYDRIHLVVDIMPNEAMRKE